MIQSNLDSLILCLIALGINSVSLVALAVDLIGVGDIRLRFDRPFTLFSIHMAQLLFLAQHAFLVLCDFLLISRDIIPIDLACALVHRVLVEALHLLRWIVHDLAHHNLRLVFVSIVERSNQFLTVDPVVGGELGTIRSGHDSLEPDVVLYI